MILKKIVTISMVISLGLLGSILITGLLIPSTLTKIFGEPNNKGDTEVVAIDKDGKKIEDATVKQTSEGTTTVVTSSGNVITNASAATTPKSNSTSGSSSSSSSTSSTPAPTTSTPTSTPTPTPTTPPPLACGAGGTCHYADISSHSSSSDCRSAITSGTSGQPSMGAYQITASFITTHNGQKSGAILNKLCGKVYTANLRNNTDKHRGSTLGGKTYDGWIANFYLGPYN